MLTPAEQRDILSRYERDRARFETVALEVGRIVGNILHDGAIRHVVTWRAKTPSSLERKLQKDRANHSLTDFARSLAPPLKDLAGVRVLIYFPSDVQSAVAELTRQFPSSTRRSHAIASGYRAEHLLVTLGDCQRKHDCGDDAKSLLCEVQLCSLADHIWNELEHDIIYKQPDGKPDPRQEELLKSLRTELDLVTGTVLRLRQRTDERIRENTGSIDTPEELRRYLEGRRETSVQGDFGALLALLTGLGISVTPAQIDGLFASGTSETDATIIAKRFDPDDAHHDVGRIVVQLLPGLKEERTRIFLSSTPTLPPLWRFLKRILANPDQEE